MKARTIVILMSILLLTFFILRYRKKKLKQPTNTQSGSGTPYLFDMPNEFPQYDPLTGIYHY